MFGSAILEVAIGLIFAFLLFSLILTAICETVESFTKTRARELERTIAELLQDPDGKGLRAKFYNHPLIYAMYPGKYDPKPFPEKVLTGEGDKAKGIGKKFGYGLWNWLRGVLDWFIQLFSWGGTKPSYIPRQQFVLAMLDLWQSGTLEAKAPTTAEPATDESKAQTAMVLLSRLSDGVGYDLRVQVESWYDGLMERVSGAYKRHVQKFLLVIGFGAAVLLNLDALVLVKELSANPTLRAALLVSAEKIVADANTPEARTATEAAAEAAVTARDAAAAARAEADKKAEAAQAQGAGDAEQAAADKAAEAATQADTDLKTAEKAADDARLAQVGVKDLIDAATEASMPMGWSHPSAKDKRECTFDGIFPSETPAGPTEEKTLTGTNPPAATPDTVAGSPAELAKRPNCAKVWGSALLGWGIMALAGTLGAPFWFDMLSKFVNIRSTVKSAEDTVSTAQQEKNPKVANAPVVVVTPAPVVAGQADGDPPEPEGPPPDRVTPFSYG